MANCGARFPPRHYSSNPLPVGCLRPCQLHCFAVLAVTPGAQIGPKLDPVEAGVVFLAPACVADHADPAAHRSHARVVTVKPTVNTATIRARAAIFRAQWSTAGCSTLP